jgi:oligosaccharide repeat unit polymerase
MNFKPDSHLRPARPALLLDWRPTLFVIIVFIAALVPLAAWAGLENPALFQGLIQSGSPTWARILAGGCIVALFLFPLCWVTISRTMDLFALFLAQNALLLCGFFFLNTTAWRIEHVGASIIQAGPLVVAINALGFAVLFASMGATYFLAWLSGAGIPPLRANPSAYDDRLIWLLRFAGVVVALVIALPMATSGTIPLLSDDPVEARFAMVQSDVARALYHAGTAVLPFLAGGLLMFVIRKPVRVLGFDGWLAGGIIFIQILTSNRLPIAITLFVTLTLATLERRWPRFLLVAVFGAFLALFAGLSGFTSILRQDRSMLGSGNVVQTSLQEAFLGDNLIDVRDAAWVMSQWDFQPLDGRTYLGGLTAMLPSGVFPMKKEWHLGLTAIRIVGWDPEEHFGLRITFFGESFLNFGPAGVIGLGVIMGCLFGTLLRLLHMISTRRPPCLHYSLKVVILMQMCLPLTNTSDAFTFWAMAAFLVIQWLWVDLGIPLKKRDALSFIPPPHAQGRL